jgi:hypothetical protein
MEMSSAVMMTMGSMRGAAAAVTSMSAMSAAGLSWGQHARYGKSTRRYE